MRAEISSGPFIGFTNFKFLQILIVKIIDIRAEYVLKYCLSDIASCITSTLYFL